MGRISPASLPLRGECTDSVLQDEQPTALLRREFQLVSGLAPAPAAQLLLCRPLQALAQQRAGGDAVRAAVDFEAQRDDAIVSHPCAEVETHALVRIARRRGNDVGRGSEAAHVAWPREVFDDD